MLDYLIVGQGTAGTCLAQRLIDCGCQIKIIDNLHKHSSSKAAAGIVNPITGRHFAKSWMIGQLLPEAKVFYRSMEELLGIQIVNETSLIRTFHDIRGENNWWSRMDRKGYEIYMSARPELGILAKMIRHPFGFGEVLQAFQVNLPLFLTKFRSYYQDMIVDQEFDYQSFEILDGEVRYKDWRANAIIFAEGYQTINNPYFKYLPFHPAKGEALIIRIPDYKGSKILRDKIFLCPIGKNRYWVGSGYDWNNLNEEVTLEEKKRLINSLEKFLGVGYEIIDQVAGVRPATLDRRPFLGVHPQYSNLYVFNGMGTKGTSLSPFWSLKMADYLVEDKPLAEEVNISRYKSQYMIATKG